MEKLNIFYVYILRRPDWYDPYYVWLSCPFYVGKGQKNRAKNHQNLNSNDGDKHKKNIIKFLKKNNLGLEIEYYAINLTEQEAFDLERKLIAFYGREDNGTGILTNLTDGGEEPSGQIITEETRKKMSEANSGEKNGFYGKKHTDETRQKISENHKDTSGENHPLYGTHHSEEHREKISNSLKGEKSPWYGRSHTEEEKKKIGNGNRGKIVSEETRKKMSRPMPEEVKFKLSKSKKELFKKKAFDECGYEDWRRCKFCHKFDDPENMYISKWGSYHRECRNKHIKEQKLKKRGETS